MLEVEKLTPTADLDSNLTPSFLAPTGAQRKRIPVVCGSIHSKVVMRVLLYATWGSQKVELERELERNIWRNQEKDHKSLRGSLIEIT